MSQALASSSDGRSKRRPGVDEQRNIILQAAVTLFANNGVRSVSIAQICGLADVSRPTFYRCFVDKEALVERLYEDSVNAHVEAFFVIGRFRSRAQLETSLDALLEAIFAQSELAQLVFIESSDPTSPAARIVDRTFEHAADVMSKSWRGSEEPSRVYLKSIMAAVQWIVQDAIRAGLTATAREEAKRAAFTLVARALS